MTSTVDRADRLSARRALLRKDKELTRLRDESGAIFHTYSTYSRGLDALNGTYQLLDLVPKGRDEAGLEYPMAWARLKNRYETAGRPARRAARRQTRGCRALRGRW